MDLGIEGKWALVCAASKGLGKGCAAALVAEGVNVVITARGAEALQATADELRALGGGEVRAVAGDITTPEGRAAALAACPQVDILINNAGGPPPGDFRELGSRDLDQGARRQHADADRADQGGGRSDDGARLRTRRQHHLGRGQGADRHPRPQQRRAQRPDRLRCRPGSQDHRQGSHDQQPAAGPVRYRPACGHRGRRGPGERKVGGRGAGAARQVEPGAAASAPGTSSAPPAPSCAAPMPAISPARTCCWMAVPTPAPSDPIGAAASALCRSAGDEDAGRDQRKRRQVVPLGRQARAAGPTGGP